MYTGACKLLQFTRKGLSHEVAFWDVILSLKDCLNSHTFFREKFVVHEMQPEIHFLPTASFDYPCSSEGLTVRTDCSPDKNISLKNFVQSLAVLQTKRELAEGCLSVIVSRPPAGDGNNHASS
jgi:hypothetical protein